MVKISVAWTYDLSHIGHSGQASVGRRRPSVQDVQIPCFRLETPALYLIRLLTNHEGHGRRQGRQLRL